MSSLIRLRDVVRSYGSPAVTALDRINLTIHAGEYVAVTGASGSGKSTLLNIMGTLDHPSSGTVFLGGKATNTLPDEELSTLRSEWIGFVFQQFHLREGVSALENVSDGLLYSGVHRKERDRWALEALHRVGLGHRTQHRPNQMSGGERQRVAIARAVIGRPPLLLADEPTGNLDSRSGSVVMDLLDSLREAGTSIVVITHDEKVAAALPRRITMTDGVISHDSSAGAAA